jgi:hypothetical protein
VNTRWTTKHLQDRLCQYHTPSSSVCVEHLSSRCVRVILVQSTTGARMQNTPAVPSSIRSQRPPLHSRRTSSPATMADRPRNTCPAPPLHTQRLRARAPKTQICFEISCISLHLRVHTNLRKPCHHRNPQTTAPTAKTSNTKRTNLLTRASHTKNSHSNHPAAFKVTMANRSPNPDPA